VLFNGLAFLFSFLLAVLAGGWAIRVPRRRAIFRALATWIFYGFAGPSFVIVMIGRVTDAALLYMNASTQFPYF